MCQRGLWIISFTHQLWSAMCTNHSLVSSNRTFPTNNTRTFTGLPFLIGVLQPCLNRITSLTLSLLIHFSSGLGHGCKFSYDYSAMGRGCVCRFHCTPHPGLIWLLSACIWCCENLFLSSKAKPLILHGLFLVTITASTFQTGSFGFQ